MVSQVRLNPDGNAAALRFEDHDGCPWQATDGSYYTDAEVASWTPLIPAPGKELP